MSTVIVKNVSKHFGAQAAVKDVSFEVNPGEIFGLLGPNGAGKTTTIRMVLDIFNSETGSIEVFGGPMTEAKKDRVGYMPEERGLYQDLPLERVLHYMAALKGLSTSESKARTGAWLERFDLADHRRKKVKELSKGMQQKAQLIATLIHEPELIIIDEPFSGLDPVNTQMVKTILRELSARGVTLIMCTHQMHQVEELCDRILLVDKGEGVLYGKLADIRRRHSGHALNVRTTGPLPALPGIREHKTTNGNTTLILEENTTPQQVLAALVAAGAQVEQFEIAVPALEEIFIQVVAGKNHPAGESRP
ncbi:MAG: ATP-binding cassette domain-containing protein [Anaerolineae bacterium]|nr:MAG: ATP-binding cassette domain-containing protein [Anaerolineae bacterium]